MENKKKVSLGTCFALASAWFGTHCGSGFASGAQATSFWVKYGAWALIMPIVSVIIMAIVAGIQWELCRLKKAYNYRLFGNALFEPHDKIFGTIYEILFLAIMIMGVSAVFAGAGSLLNSWLGIPYVLGVVITIGITVLLTMFGSKLLLRSASALSTILIVVITICTIYGMTSSGSRLVEVATNWETGGSFGAALWSAILYASFQCIIVGSSHNLSRELKTTADSKLSAIIGFLMNGAMMVLLSYMLLSFYPAVISETLPVYSALETLGIPWLSWAYSLMLFLAFITTAITCIGSIVTRFENYGAKAIKNDTARRFTYSLLLIILCFFIAQVGLLNIIKLGYTAVGYLGIPFVILPTLFVGIPKIIKLHNIEKNSVKEN